jgi:transcriptional regulator with XRE-family HTH domain
VILKVPIRFDVRAARQSLGWSQRRIAQEAGITLDTMRRIEREGVASQRVLWAVTAALTYARRNGTRR